MRTNILLAVGLLAVVGIGGNMLLQSNHEQLMSVLPSPHVAAPAHKDARGATEPAEPANPNVVKSHAPERVVQLPYYVVHDTGDDLQLVERHAPLRAAGTPSEWRQARTALTALENTPHTGGAYDNPLPEGTHILGVHIDITTGIATVNLSPQFRENFNGGARAEQMTVYALVNTVGRVPGVKGVTFQVAGKPIEEFAGHLDLSEPLVPDMTIVEKAS